MEPMRFMVLIPLLQPKQYVGILLHFFERHGRQ